MKSSAFCLMLGLAAFNAMHVTSANADEWFPIVEFTCLPEINYFHLQTTGLYNIEPQKIPNASWDGKARMNLALLRDWLKYPISCRIGRHEFEAQIVDYQSPTGPQECGAVEDAGFALSLDGKKIISSHSIYGGCQVSIQVDLKISNYEVVYCQTTMEFNIWNLGFNGSTTTNNCQSIRIPR